MCNHHRSTEHPSSPSPEEDWLCHDGNAHYARNRRDFMEYQAVDASQGLIFALTPGAAEPEVPVLGKGKVRLHIKKRLGSSDHDDIVLYDVYHIPSAMCNGISLNRLYNRSGAMIQRYPDLQFSIIRIRNGSEILCGSETSGRMRVYGAGEDESTGKQLRHFTVSEEIDFSMREPESLYTQLQHPNKGSCGSMYFPVRTDTHHCRFCHHQEPSEQSQVTHSGFLHPDIPPDKPIDDDDMTAKELWGAYRNDPDRLEHKQREKREREEDRERERDVQKSRKVNRERSPTPPRTPVQLDCDDWLFHDGNVHYVRDQSSFVSFKQLDAEARLIKTTPYGKEMEFISVTGIGTVQLKVKRQLGQIQAGFHDILLPNTLYIREAPCNGISREVLEDNGYRFTQINHGANKRFCIKPPGKPKPVACGTASSGQARLLFPHEDDLVAERQHVTLELGCSITISANTYSLNWKDDPAPLDYAEAVM